MAFKLLNDVNALQKVVHFLAYVIEKSYLCVEIIKKMFNNSKFKRVMAKTIIIDGIEYRLTPVDKILLVNNKLGKRVVNRYDKNGKEINYGFGAYDIVEVGAADEIKYKECLFDAIMNVIDII